ncbi:MAG: biotin--[acetyl-CoA-carboxylase] ligase [Lachnospiraceae bacterium]|nr:biotin--[acetyl-CoA-carboxylase] ligase [Lachnospiraceae bacterium]
MNKLTSEELGKYIGAERMEKLLCLETTDSTNLYLQRLISRGCPDRMVVTAGEQTRGRGRLGRSFDSPKDKGIYLSYLLKHKGDPGDVNEITAMTAVAVSDAIYKSCGLETGIKWVNDLVIDKKKVCGILTEMLIEGDPSEGRQNIIIGIGLNVNQETEDFPEALRSRAGSLRLFGHRIYDRAEIIAAMVEEVDNMFEKLKVPLKREEILKKYRDRCITLNKEVSVTPVAISGNTDPGDPNHLKAKHARVLGINPDFTLQVIYEDGREESLSAGEVSIRGMYGYI